MNTLYGIGVGPGDPELLTLRAVAILNRVSTVVGPRPRAGDDSLAARIAGPHLSPGAHREELVFPMTRDRDALRSAWTDAARRILSLLEDGDVAFLTLGDASLYSTWTYLRSAICAISPGQAVETVPGITSFAAAAARSGRALAEGDRALLVVPWAVSGERSWLLDALDAGASAAFLKVADRLPELDAALRRSGRTDSVLVSRATLPEEIVSEEWQDDPSGRGGYLSVVLSSEEEP